MFSSEFCEISKNTFSYRTPVSASMPAGILNTNRSEVNTKLLGKYLRGSLLPTDLQTGSFLKAVSG